MKFILLMLIQAGSGVVSADRMAAVSAEFDDEQACISAGIAFRKRLGNEARTSGICVPKGSNVPEVKVSPPEVKAPAAEKKE
jgi:hypothetical protein